MPQLAPGSPFPDLALESREGEVRLSERWRYGPLVLAFQRHFGWPFCREHLAQLGRHYDEFRQAGAEVLAVFQYRADPTFHFCRKRNVPFDCLGDPEREGYRAVGLERGPAREVVGPQLIPGFLRAARHGALPGIPKGDTAQRPGTFVVSPEGLVLCAHYHRDSSDNPASEDLLAAVRAAAEHPPGH